MTTRNQYQFRDCRKTIPGNHFLCSDHYTGYEAAAIDQCPACGKYKDAAYNVCYNCYRQQAGEPSSPFVNAGQQNDRLPTNETHKIKTRLIKQSGKRCEGCGWQARQNVHEHALARREGTFELDHKVPLARGGTNDFSNLWVLCLPCHDGKTAGSKNMTAEEWIAADRPQDWSRKGSNMQRRRSRR